MLPELTIVSPLNNAKKEIGDAFVVRVNQVTDESAGHGYAHLHFSTETSAGPWNLASAIGHGGVCESNTQPWSNEWASFAVQGRITVDCWIRVGVWPTEALDDNEPTVAVSDAIFLDAVVVQDEPID